MNILEELKNKLQDKVNFKISDIHYYNLMGGELVFYVHILNTPFNIEFPNFQGVLDKSDEDDASPNEFKIYPDEDGENSVDDLVAYILDISKLIVDDTYIYSITNSKTLDSIIKSFNTLEYASSNDDTFDNRQDFEKYVRKQGLLDD